MDGLALFYIKKGTSNIDYSNLIPVCCKGNKGSWILCIQEKVHSLIHTQQCVTTVIGCTGYGTSTFDSQGGRGGTEIALPQTSLDMALPTHTHTGCQDGNFSLHFYKCVFYFTTNYRLLVIEKAQWYAATETKTYAI